MIRKDFREKDPNILGDVVYRYDEAVPNGRGKLAAVIQDGLETHYKYDSLGRVLETTRKIDDQTYTEKNDYDLAGRIRAITYPDGGTINYVYNGPLLERVFDDNTTFARYADFNALGQPGQIKYANGTTMSYRFAGPNNQKCPQANNRLCSAVIVGPAAQLYSASYYEFDRLGNTTKISDGQSVRNSYSYDDLNRLVEAKSHYVNSNTPAQSPIQAPDHAAESLQTESYSYDEIGNVTSDSSIGPFNYRGSSQYLQSAGGEEFEYDKNGNVVTAGERKFWYDFENRLVKVKSGKLTTEFTYDDNGIRVKKKTNRSLKKAANELLEGQISNAKKSLKDNETIYVGNLYECKADGCIKNIWAGGTRIAQQRSGEPANTIFLHSNYQGSLTLITDRSGAAVEHISYGPFGIPDHDSNSQQGLEPLHIYSGHEIDDSSGLYYFGSRYYDPKISRFVSPDSVVAFTIVPPALNRYSYALNNPATLVDPDGHFAFLAIFIGMAIGAAVGGVAAVIQGGNFWKGAAIGAIAGAFTGGTGALIGEIGVQGFALQAALYAVGGAAAGVVNASIFGGDIGRAALVGAAAGFSGYALGGLDAALANNGVPLSNLLSGAVKGGFIGGTYAGITGTNFWDGFAAGAQAGALGAAANMMIGHSVGYVVTGGERPSFKNGVFVYTVSEESPFYDRFYADKEYSYFTVGNVVIGKGDLNNILYTPPDANGNSEQLR